MSHAATNWAITQRGLKPATKIVLWHLADCHNPTHGCFPSQEYLADCCEMSRSSLNEHLVALEQAGLIRREQRRDKRTRRQESTRYYLAFEADFAGNPCPENGHGSPEAVSGNRPGPCPENAESRVQNPDTNPVREPVKEPLSAQARGREGEISIDRKKAEADGWALLKDWPGFAAMPKEPAFREWMALSPEEREIANARFSAWIALLRKQKKSHVPAPSTYFREKLFLEVPDPEEAPAQPIEAKPFGPLWNATIIQTLLSDPQPAPPPTSAFMRELLKRNDETGRAERKRRQVQFGWPRVNDWYHRAESRKGFAVQPQHRWMGELMEAVPVTSSRFEEWRAEYERRGWPWLPDWGAQPVVYFPKGGPEGLSEFERAVRAQEAEDDGSERKAAG